MRIALVSASRPAEALEVLRDLGCRPVEHFPSDDPVEIARGGDAVLVECGGDVDPMRTLLFKLRRAGAASVLLAVSSDQVLRVDPGTTAPQTIASGLPIGPPPGVVPKPLKGMPPFSGPQGPFAGIAAAPDGTLYISADGDGSVLALRPERERR